MGISPRVFHLDYRNILFKKRLRLKVEKYLGIMKYQCRSGSGISINGGVQL